MYERVTKEGERCCRSGAGSGGNVDPLLLSCNMVYLLFSVFLVLSAVLNGGGAEEE